MKGLQEKKDLPAPRRARQAGKILEYKKVFALSENEIEQIIDLWDYDTEVLEPKEAQPYAQATEGLSCPRCLSQLSCDFECNACGWGKNGDITESSAFLLGYADCGC